MNATQEKSELKKLLEKNVTFIGLTETEWERAHELIDTAENTEQYCWLCRDVKAIYDTGLCQGHARYALTARK